MRRSRSTLLLLLHDEHTLPHSVSLWMHVLAGSKAVCFLKRLTIGLSSRWDRSYPEVLCWIQTRPAFAILHATGLCVLGSRSKWRCLGLEDGAAIDNLTWSAISCVIFFVLLCCMFILYRFVIFVFVVFCSVFLSIIFLCFVLLSYSFCLPCNSFINSIFCFCLCYYVCMYWWFVRVFVCVLIIIR